MSVKSKKESVKNALGGVMAIGLFGGNYLAQTEVVKHYLYDVYWYYLELLEDYIGLPAEIINVIIVITIMYVSLKIAESSIKVLVLIGWILIAILVIARLVFSFSIAPYLPGE